MSSLNEKQAERYLLSKPEVKLDFPFGEEVKVFKVKNKMFATLLLEKWVKGMVRTMVKLFLQRRVITG